MPKPALIMYQLEVEGLVAFASYTAIVQRKMQTDYNLSGLGRCALYAIATNYLYQLDESDCAFDVVCQMQRNPEHFTA